MNSIFVSGSILMLNTVLWFLACLWIAGFVVTGLVYVCTLFSSWSQDLTFKDRRNDRF